MELLHPLDANKKLLLYTADSRLYSLLLQGERFSRPNLLCSNYDNGLSSVLYRGTVYYTYINKEFSLLVRNSSDSGVLFRLDCTSHLSFHLPQLVVFNETLLLFYFEKQQDTYSLLAHALFTGMQPSPFPSLFSEHFSELPGLTLFAEPTCLYLLLSDSRASRLLRYTTDFLCSGPLEDPSEFIAALAEKEQKLQETEQYLDETQKKFETVKRLLNNQTRNLEHSNSLLTETQKAYKETQLRLRQAEDDLQHIRNQLAECETARREALQNLAQTSGLLERAKAQYEELMQVALQYKEEAAKWYTKFTDRH